MMDLLVNQDQDDIRRRSRVTEMARTEIQQVIVASNFKPAGDRFTTPQPVLPGIGRGAGNLEIRKRQCSGAKRILPST